MKKVYTTDQERKSDRLRGCIIFPLVNGALWVFALMADSLLPEANRLFCLMAWPVNGIILTWAFSSRPEVGAGFISFIALAVVALIMLCCLCLASCVTGFTVTISLEDVLGSIDDGIPVAHALGYLVAIGLFLGILIFLYRWASATYQNGSSSPRSGRRTQDE